MKRSLVSLGIGLVLLSGTSGSAPAWAEHGGGHDDDCCDAQSGEACEMHEGRSEHHAERSEHPRAQRRERAQDDEMASRRAALGAAVEQAHVMETVRIIQALDLTPEQGGRFAALMESAETARRNYAILNRRIMMTLAEKVGEGAEDAVIADILADMQTASTAHDEWERTHATQVKELLGPQKAARFLLIRTQGPRVRIGGVRRGAAPQEERAASSSSNPRYERRGTPVAGSR